MTTLSALLESAQQQQTQHQLPYFGALTPQESWALLQASPLVKLVDVRTRAELDWVGRPLVPTETQFAHVEWVQYPGGVPNAAFLSQLEEACPDKNAPVLFLCRSAVRSKHAAKAAAAAGYTHAMDVLEGFEGNKSAEGHRKTVEGWCYRTLPWVGA